MQESAGTSQSAGRSTVSFGHPLNEVPLEEVAKLAKIGLFTLIPLTVAFIVTGYFSNSLTIISIALESGFSIIVQAFAYASIRAMKTADPIRFPHGTGKLENFSGFLYGALTIPVGVYIFYKSAANLLDGPGIVSFSIAQLPMLPSIIRSLYLYSYSGRLNRQFESPLIESYHANMKVTVYFDILVILALGLGFVMTKMGHGVAADFVDPIFSLGVALFMLYSAGEQLLKNFRVLIDLPMPESEQLEIIRVLASEFDSYEQIGSIRTRRSGMQRLIEIELYFASSVEVQAIDALTRRLQNKLSGGLHNARLNILVMEAKELDYAGDRVPGDA